MIDKHSKAARVAAWRRDVCVLCVCLCVYHAALRSDGAFAGLAFGPSPRAGPVKSGRRAFSCPPGRACLRELVSACLV